MKRFAPTAGWTGLFFAFTALFFYIVVPAKVNLNLTLLLIAIINLAVFAWVEKSAIREAFKGRAAVYGLNTTVMVIVFLGILVFINMLSFRHKNRLDLTEGKLYSLAAQTEKIVSNLPRDVKMTAFFQSEAPTKNEFDLLAQGYLAQSDKLSLEFVDPDKSPAITKRYGVTTYGTVVLESGGQETKIASPTEENLTNGLLKVITDEKKSIYFLEGHGEAGIEDNSKEGYSTVKKALEKDNYKVEKLLLLQSGKVPDGASLVVINSPRKPLLPEEIKGIESYLNQGGSVFLLLDPDVDSGFKPFLDSWGIEIKNDVVIDPLSKLFGGDFAAPIIQKYTFHDITKDFGLATIFPLVRSITPKSTPGIETVELLKTGENSWAEMDITDEKVKFDEGKDLQGPVSIGVIATKKLAGEKPEPEESEEKGSAKPEKATLVVFGDSDFANNNYFNFTGNGDFFLNVTSWLAQEENLIAIRAKERKSSPVQLTSSQGSMIFMLGVVVFPVIVILTGVKVWWRRRSL